MWRLRLRQQQHDDVTRDVTPGRQVRRRRDDPSSPRACTGGGGSSSSLTCIGGSSQRRRLSLGDLGRRRRPPSLLLVDSLPALVGRLVASFTRSLAFLAASAHQLGGSSGGREAGPHPVPSSLDDEVD